jgi:predicted phage baseplate assembly protein
MKFSASEARPPLLQLRGRPPEAAAAWGDWELRESLLDSGPADRHFVVEVESDGTTTLRFGDKPFGTRPASGTSFVVSYRVGNGVAGNVGAGALAHVVTDIDGIKADGVGNPLPARGGAEPESIEEVRRSAPAAFRTQERAVTADDYARVAERGARRRHLPLDGELAHGLPHRGSHGGLKG